MAGQSIYPITVASGFSYAVPNDCGQLSLSASAPMASGSVTMPPSPEHNQLFTISCNQPVASFTLTAGSQQSIVGVLTAMVANGSKTWRYFAPTLTWYPASINQTVSGKFISGLQAIATSSVIPVAHGLPATPNFFHLYLMCTAAELGYAVGDEVRLDAFGVTIGGTMGGNVLNVANITFAPTNKFYGANVVVNATNIMAVVAQDGIQVLNRTAGSVGLPATITPANWGLILVAYL